jgi:MFS family permease
MNIQRVYLSLTLLNTLATSFIWGVNTLFLLDAGLTNAQAFAANAFFTLGQVIFEVPTGVVADRWGRRVSYLLGTLTLGATTLFYWSAWLFHAPFGYWAVASVLLGLGFTFFSGATDAWLVDALAYTGFKGALESVFARAQIVGGIAMLFGSVAGGLIAQATNLGAPYLLRAAALGLNFAIAFWFMRDLGFEPSRSPNLLRDMKQILAVSAKVGLGNPSIRWMMLAAPFTSGVSIYAFYAMQPYLLGLYGNEHAYGIGGLAAAIVAGAQIVGGLAVVYIRRLFRRRTSLLATGILINVVLLALVGLAAHFWIAIAILVLWGLLFAATAPVRSAYLNGLIPSSQRATVLSFDSLIGSSGGVIIQPALGRVADLSGYGFSYLVGGMIQLLSLPFVYLARRENPKSDPILPSDPDPKVEV